MAQSTNFGLWLNIVKSIPKWEWITGGTIVLAAVFLFVLYEFFSLDKFNLFHAFEKFKLSSKDAAKSFKDSIYFEITIARDSKATAFQVQQKILKALHSVYKDPVEGPHAFKRYFYFFQKLYRFWKVYRSRQVFFTLQIWAQYPYISFRMVSPKASFGRIEKAIFNAYPNAGITILDQEKTQLEVTKFQKSYLSFGETTIEGKFFHRIKTFKDVSSDPVDSIVSVMEGLEKGRFMVYNLTIAPISHYFNQIIHYLIEETEAEQEEAQGKKKFQAHKKGTASELLASLAIAMLEKMKSPLFQVVISYWTVSSTPEDAESKLENIQAVLTEINQKNMNMLKHHTLQTKQVEELETSGELAKLIETTPVFKIKKHRFWPLNKFRNFGQIVSDIELYSFWHLPNTNEATVSSIKMARYKKLPASHQMREFESFFAPLGHSNFRMQESTPIGISTWEDMKKHLYILGGTGSGKSETLKTILSNLLEKEGEKKPGLLIIDPKNDFATDLLTMIPEDRREDVIYFNPQKQKERPLSFPFFSQFSGSKTDDERIEFLISIMKRFVQIDSMYSWGPELENILRQLFATAYLLPEQSLSGLDLLLHEPNQIKNILKYLPGRLQKFWTGRQK